MFRVTPPNGLPVIKLFPSLEKAMQELAHHMYISPFDWNNALID